MSISHRVKQELIYFIDLIIIEAVAKRKKKTVKEKKPLLWGIFTSLVFISALLFSISKSPYFTTPNPNAMPDMVALPPEMEQVLGTTSNSRQYRIPILMYHYVEYVADAGDKTRISLNVIPPVLEEQIKTLKDGGYTFITASELDNVLNGRDKLLGKPILLTFDDGYRDFYTDAYPILKKYNVKATQYVITGFLDRPNHLLTSQLKEIAKDGLVEIGAHTVNHLWLKGLSKETVTYEVGESRKTLQDLLHLPINSFAYPYGAFDEQVRQIVKDAGFSDAMSTLPGISQSTDNKYFLYRLRPGWRSGNNLLSYISQPADSYSIK